jgi:hypothetical protein
MKSIHLLRRLRHTYNQTLQWHDQQQASLTLKNTNTTYPLLFNDIMLCLPSYFDLTPSDLMKQFNCLKLILNASNAKYVSNGMMSISRKIPDEIFLKDYLQLIQNETFQKLGKSNNSKRLFIFDFLQV